MWTLRIVQLLISAAAFQSVACIGTATPSKGQGIQQVGDNAVAEGVSPAPLLTPIRRYRTREKTRGLASFANTTAALVLLFLVTRCLFAIRSTLTSGRRLALGGGDGCGSSDTQGLDTVSLSVGWETLDQFDVQNVNTGGLSTVKFQGNRATQEILLTLYVTERGQMCRTVRELQKPNGEKFFEVKVYGVPGEHTVSWQYDTTTPDPPPILMKERIILGNEETTHVLSIDENDRRMLVSTRKHGDQVEQSGLETEDPETVQGEERRELARIILHMEDFMKMVERELMHATSTHQQRVQMRQQMGEPVYSFRDLPPSPAVGRRGSARGRGPLRVDDLPPRPPPPRGPRERLGLLSPELRRSLEGRREPFLGPGQQPSRGRAPLPDQYLREGARPRPRPLPEGGVQELFDRYRYDFRVQPGHLGDPRSSSLPRSHPHGRVPRYPEASTPPGPHDPRMRAPSRDRAGSLPPSHPHGGVPGYPRDPRILELQDPRLHAPVIDRSSSLPRSYRHGGVPGYPRDPRILELQDPRLHAPVIDRSSSLPRSYRHGGSYGDPRLHSPRIGRSSSLRGSHPHVGQPESRGSPGPQRPHAPAGPQPAQGRPGPHAPAGPQPAQGRPGPHAPAGPQPAQGRPGPQGPQGPQRPEPGSSSHVRRSHSLSAADSRPGGQGHQGPRGGEKTALRRTKSLPRTQPAAGPGAPYTPDARGHSEKPKKGRKPRTRDLGKAKAPDLSVLKEGDETERSEAGTQTEPPPRRSPKAEDLPEASSKEEKGAPSSESGPEAGTHSADGAVLTPTGHAEGKAPTEEETPSGAPTEEETPPPSGPPGGEGRVAPSDDGPEGGEEDTYL